MKKLIKKITRKIGLWFLKMSNAESLDEMSDKLLELAHLHNEKFTSLEVKKTTYDFDRPEITYTVYINNKEHEEGSTFTEAYNKMKSSFDKKPPKKKEILI